MFVGNCLGDEGFCANENVIVRFEICSRWVGDVVRPTSFAKSILNIRCPATVVCWVKSGDLFESIFGCTRLCSVTGWSWRRCRSVLLLSFVGHDALWREIGT